MRVFTHRVESRFAGHEFKIDRFCRSVAEAAQYMELYLREGRRARIIPRGI